MKRRVKLNNKNFRVKQTQVYIAKATPFRPAPKPEIVEVVRKIWNKQSPKFTKHIKRICIQKSIQQYGDIQIGYYNTTKHTLKIFDTDIAKLEDYEVTVIHEMAHAWFQWAYKYHREELKTFCEAVINLPPFNTYLKNHERRWRKTVGEKQILADHNEKWANQYPNEYHSVLAEQIEASVDVEDQYHEMIITQKTFEKAKAAYDELHNITSDTRTYISKRSTL